MAINIARRKFITALGGATAAWPLAVRAQQPKQMRRIGVLMNLAEDDPQGSVELAVFKGGLQERGWTLGGNLQIDYRWGAGDANLYRKYALELVALAPDVILVVGGTAVGALQQVSRAVPIVFVGVTDPVNRGLVASLASPGGNATGFLEFEYGMCGKWAELLKQIVPSATRATVIRDPIEFSGIGQFAAIQSAAPGLGIEVSPVDARDAKEIERAIIEFARRSNGGLIVTLSASAIGHRDLIVALAAGHKLSAVYPARFFATGGGLISYGPDPIDGYRRAAGYVDRILKGEKPADLPVQAPTKLELTINLKTARALGLTIPDKLLATANEVIE
jgi:putative ABC transport system substrate-binding protein